MCVVVDGKITAAVKERLKSDDTFWKVYRVAGRCLASVLFSRKVGGVVAEAGRKASSRERAAYPLPNDEHCAGTWGEINILRGGYYVFPTRSDAKRWERRYALGVVCSIVPVHCQAEDFVAAGKSQCGDVAVFTHINIKEEDFRKAVS